MATECLKIEFSIVCGCSKKNLEMSVERFQERVLQDFDEEGIRKHKGEGFLSSKCYSCEQYVFIPHFDKIMELIKGDENNG